MGRGKTRFPNTGVQPLCFELTRPPLPPAGPHSTLPGPPCISAHIPFSLCACSVAQLCLTFCSPVDCSPPGSSVHGIPPGKNVGVGCHFLLQGVFLTQELNATSPALAGRFFTTSVTCEGLISLPFQSGLPQLFLLDSEGRNHILFIQGP